MLSLGSKQASWPKWMPVKKERIVHTWLTICLSCKSPEHAGRLQQEPQQLLWYVWTHTHVDRHLLALDRQF